MLRKKGQKLIHFWKFIPLGGKAGGGNNFFQRNLRTSPNMTKSK